LFSALFIFRKRNFQPKADSVPSQRLNWGYWAERNKSQPAVPLTPLFLCSASKSKSSEKITEQPQNLGDCSKIYSRLIIQKKSLSQFIILSFY
jgi:hypothetical protein